MFDCLIIGSIEDSKECLLELKDNKKNYCICDMFDNNETLKNYPCFSLTEIMKYEYDFIVITCKTCSEFMKCVLINQYSVSSNIIIEFWKSYYKSIPIMKCDKEIMRNKRKIDGIIIGISHAEVGLIADKFTDNVVNLSISSQDLYNQYNTMLYCFAKYPEVLSNLNYVIIDLYDYNYFNFDTSLSKNAVQYWMDGGFNLLDHHFAENKRFDFELNDVRSEIDNYWGVSPEMFEKWKSLFPNIHSKTNYEGFESVYSFKNRQGIVTDQMILDYEYGRSTVTKLHNETIVENVDFFHSLLSLIKSVNEKTRIYTIIIPKFIETEQKDELLLSKHKQYFNTIIKEAKSRYSFTHIDFKEQSDISKNRLYYYDAAHLNWYGAYVLTQVLNDIVHDEENYYERNK